jgi:glycosyltransferase involved in cell wall biosynthesis
MKKKIAVITPYYKEPTEMLFQAHSSVLEQNTDEVVVDHIMVADGFPNPQVNGWKVKHFILPDSHGDNGNTPRGLGSLLAVSEEYDFIAYLDADNWYSSDHLSSLLRVWVETSADVCCSMRTLHQIDGSLIDAPLDDDELKKEFVDTSCYLLSKSAFKTVKIWLDMPKQLSPICDRVFFSSIKHHGLRLAFTGKPTLAFRSQYLGHYAKAGLPLSEFVKGDVVGEVNAWLLSIEGARETAKKIGFLPI